MVYFLKRGDRSLICETRLAETGPGYELVITKDGSSHIEPYADLAVLLAREHELIQAWRAQGWSEVKEPARAAVTWRGPGS